jgi:predicted Zn-dependent protease
MSRAMKYWLALLLVVVAGNASAQRLLAPGEVVIFVHQGMTNADFVEPLVCALSKVLRPPVRVSTIDLALTEDLLETPSQFSARKIVARVAQVPTDSAGQTMPFRYFLLDRDLKGPSGGRYSFIESYHAPWNAGVLSVMRLAPTEKELGRDYIADATQRRAYKLLMKSIGRMSGLRSDGCVLKQSHSVEELDAKSSEFCPQDREALVAAAVLKERPSESCSTVVAGR